MKLHTKVLVGLGAGLVAGLLGSHLTSPWATQAFDWMSVFGRLFIRLIAMLVVPLVVASMMVGIASVGDLRTLSRVGARTLLSFLLTTLVAASLGAAVAVILHPGTGMNTAGIMTGAPFGTVLPGKDTGAHFPEALLDMVPANPIGSAASGDLFGVIVFTLLFGAAVGTLAPQRRAILVEFFAGINDAAMRVVGWIMKIAPTAVFCLIASAVAKFGAHVLRALAMFCVTVIAGLVLQVLIVHTLILVAACKRSPVRFFQQISDVALMAFSTSSSSATLPLSLQVAEERLEIPPSVASFVVPLGVTMNKNGSALYKSAAVVFIAQLAGMHLGWSLLTRILLAATLSAMTTAGVPGSGLVAIVVVLQMVGLGALAPIGSVLVAGVDRILDMLRTTVNVVGTMVCAAYVAATTKGSLAAAVPSGITALELSVEIVDEHLELAQLQKIKNSE